MTTITIDVGWFRRSRGRDPILVGRERGVPGSMISGRLLDPVLRPGRSRRTLSSRFPGVAKYIRRRYGIKGPLYLVPVVQVAGSPNSIPPNQWRFLGYGLDVTVNYPLVTPMTHPTSRFRVLRAAARTSQPPVTSGSAGGRTP